MSNVFCLLNCFNNYEIVASKVIEMYISNAISHLSPKNNVKIYTYFNSTPFLLYAMYFLPNEFIPLPKNIIRTKQFTDYIIILSLTAVTLARIYNSNATVFAHQGPTFNSGFVTMMTIARELNKKTVYWTDDLRNIWGSTDNPLFIGMSPLPYKYLWTSQNSQCQPKEFNTQPKGLNGNFAEINLARDENTCPVISEEKFKDNWNSFIELLNRTNSITKQTIPGYPNSRTNNLIYLGNEIINFIENKGKDAWNPTINKNIYFDLENVISQNLDLLYEQEQDFFIINTNNKCLDDKISKTIHTDPYDIKNNSLHSINNNSKNQPAFFNLNKQYILQAMTQGFSEMTKINTA